MQNKINSQNKCVLKKMYSAIVYKIRKHDEIFLQNFILDKEISYNIKIHKNINTIKIKTAIVKIYYLNRQLKILNKELKNNLLDDNWNKKFNFCENLKKDIKVLLEIIKFNKIQYVKELLNKKIKSKKKRKEKSNTWILKHIYMDKMKSRLAINIANWMKLKQNEIDREKEKKSLHKNADIVLSDVRANRIDVKKFLIILKELDNLRKVKVAIARIKGEVIAFEADMVFNNIIVKLMQQWARLDREYILEEKGLNLMIKTGNEQTILKHTKNLYEEWEIILFQNKICINITENFKHFVILRMLWDTYITESEGTGIPVGWVIPFESTNGWLKCSQKKITCSYGAYI